MKKIKGFLARIKKVLSMPQMLLLPGQLAFFIVLAIIPTITLISYGASVLNLSLDFISNFLTRAFSPEIANLIVSSSSIPHSTLQLTIILVLCYYVASNGMDSVIVTSNAIYGIPNTGFFRRRLKAILMSIIFVIMVVFLLVVPILGNQIMGLIEWVNLYEPVTKIIQSVYVYLQSPIIWILLFFLIKTIYIMAPDRKIKGHNATYGAIFTTISWVILTYGYSFYINNIADFSALYGGFTSVCVLMMWIFFISYLFVVGMSLNYQRENEELEKTGVIKNSKK